MTQEPEPEFESWRMGEDMDKELTLLAMLQRNRSFRRIGLVMQLDRQWAIDENTDQPDDQYIVVSYDGSIAQAIKAVVAFYEVEGIKWPAKEALLQDYHLDFHNKEYAAGVALELATLYPDSAFGVYLKGETYKLKDGVYEDPEPKCDV